jgi:sugar/nucleoside kinase (ribokinase family)
VHVGPPVLTTGGAVPNTGLALHRLGVPTRLLGKLGDDFFGQAILEVIRSRDPALATDMIVDPTVASSYTIVISAPGLDRSFLHCPGANDSFGAVDVDVAGLAGTAIFHFGYPPLMQRMHIDGGDELALMLGRIKAAGIMTSLDMAHVDPGSSAGQVDWRALLAKVLPQADLFAPNLEEAFSMVDPAGFQRALQAGDGTLNHSVDGPQLHALASTLLEMGAAIVCIKLGDQGVYLRTTPDAARLAQLGPLTLGTAWRGCEFLVPAFEVNVAGTTGAGDCAVAGLITGILSGQSPVEAATSAAGAGACNVEQTDASSGIPTWEALQQRIHAGWPRRPVRLALPGWRCDAAHAVYHAPAAARLDFT